MRKKILIAFAGIWMFSTVYNTTLIGFYTIDLTSTILLALCYISVVSMLGFAALGYAVYGRIVKSIPIGIFLVSLPVVALHKGVDITTFSMLMGATYAVTTIWAMLAE